MALMERVAPDTRGARDSLRTQIARLERELAEILASTYPPVAPPPTRRSAARRPTLIGLEALEAARDDLAHRLSQALRTADDQRRRQDEAQALLEDLLAHPEKHPRVRIANTDLGLPGCTTYTVVRRLTSPWWRVKISSGCPLPSAAP
jgi:hypothetical protein